MKVKKRQVLSTVMTKRSMGLRASMETDWDARKHSGVTEMFAMVIHISQNSPNCIPETGTF